MNFNNGLKCEYWNKSLKELLDAPVYALNGISEKEADFLFQALKIKTINDFAKLQSVKVARSIMTLADLEQDEKSDGN
jgi:hypothetical protein